MKKLIKLQNNKITEVFCGTDFEYAISKGFVEKNVEQGYDGGWYLEGTAPKKPIEDIKKEKKELLKKERDNFLKENNYDFSENDKFNIMNLLNGFTEGDKTNYINFLNNLISQYNNINDSIKNAKTIEEVNNISIEFTNTEEDLLTTNEDNKK